MPLDVYFLTEVELRFDIAFGRILPAFQARLKRRPGEAHAWCCTADDCLQLAIWVVWRRPTLGFMIDIGWSNGGALPNKASMFANAGPDAAQHRFALPELWSPGHPGSGWSCFSSGADIPARSTQWGLSASRQSERGYRILEDGLLNIDRVTDDAIGKLLEHGVPFFRRVAVMHGMESSQAERALPPTVAPRPSVADNEIATSARFGRLRAAGHPPADPSISREVWATTVAMAPETRWALRQYAALRSRFKGEMPHFWRIPTVITGTEVVISGLVVGSIVAANKGPDWLTPVLFIALFFSGLANPWIRYKRRLMRCSKRTCTERRFLEELDHLIPNPPAEEIAVAVRRAYALALDLPIDAVRLDNRMPAFRLGDCPPMLHEFAIYLSESLPSKPDPFILGNLLARHKRRAGILDFIEATEAAMQVIRSSEL